MKRNLVTMAIGCTAAALGLTESNPAHACGCFAPPIPTPQTVNFAVNQQAEQIVFEVGEGTVTAHVRILYQGEPEQFAWLLPMPSVPDIELSTSSLFGLIDRQTQPLVSQTNQLLCPQQRYICRTHPPCPSPVQPNAGALFDPTVGAPMSAPNAEGLAGDSAGVAAPPVQVLASERVGSYDTITFAADEASLAIEWLNDNGFIVNETMSPYMQPYLDAGLVFVASKLVPGADVDEIRPLSLTYEANSPSIPLQLTAIAAEPHMVVTAFIYADQEFAPILAPQIEVPAEELLFASRSNYPMLLARAVDEAGGFAFVKEYVGAGPVFQDPTGCCTGTAPVSPFGVPGVPVTPTPTGAAGAGAGDGIVDVCGVGNDGLCQCPGTDFDVNDCAADEDLMQGVNEAQRLRAEYPVMTRLTTRISPEEMVIDPSFEPDESDDPPGSFRLSLVATRYQLNPCEAQVIDQERYQEIVDVDACAAMYCDWGTCAVTDSGAGCRCDEGFVARVFTDADGLPSVTCVPETPPVDLAAGGIDVPDACDGITLEGGTCSDLGGFPAVACDEDRAAIVQNASVPVPAAACAPILRLADGPGAKNYTTALTELEVCAPPPPSCASNGWLEEVNVENPGVDCGDGPDSSWFEVPPAPDCSAPNDNSSTTTPGSPPQVNAEAPVSSPSTVTTPVQYMDTKEPRPGTETETETAEESNKSDRAGGGLCSMAAPQHAPRSALYGFGLLGLLVFCRRRRVGDP